MNEGCLEMEPLLAGRSLGELTTIDERRLAAHLAGCAGCRAVADEIDGGALGQALLDLGVADDADFAELGVVAPENYVRGEEIGRGGMGRIVRARDRRLGRSVVLKELLDGRLRQRFEGEARLTARLMHPAIVNVLEAGRWPSGAPFYAMKHVAGEPLDRKIAACRTLDERIALLPNLIAVVEAVAYAHHERVIHRDLKPANVLVGPYGETVVIDWGLAKDLAAADAVEAAGDPYRDRADLTLGAAGTPNYMPPEQAEGRGSDPRVDVYALGATLYHLLSGQPPYGTVGARRVLERLAAGPPAPLAALEPKVPPALAAIVAKAMAREPAQRYAAANDLAEELRRFQSGQLVAAHRYRLGEHAARLWRRHRAVATLAASSLLALAMVGGVALHKVVATRAEAERQLAALLLERASHELDDALPTRALPYVAAALARGADGAGVRTLLAQAARPLDSVVGSVVVDAGPVSLARLSPDGARLVTSGTSGVALWALPEAKRVATLPGHKLAPDLLLFSPDGKLLVTGSRCMLSWCAGTLRAWDPADGAPRPLLPDEAPLDEGRFEERALRFDDQLPQAFARLTGMWPGVGAPWRLPAGAREELVARSFWRRVVWRTDGAVDLRLPGRWVQLAAGRVTGVRLSADEGRAVTLGRDGAVRAFDLVDGAPAGVWDVSATPLLDAALLADGRLVTVDEDGRVRLHRPADGRVATAELGSSSSRLLVGDDGLPVAPGKPKRGLAVRAGDPPRAVITDLDSGKTVAELPIRYAPVLARQDLVLSEDGRRLAVLGSERRATIYELASGATVTSVLEGGTIELVAFHGDRFFTAGADIGVTVWTVDGRRLAHLAVDAGALVSCAWSPDGARVAVGERDGTASVYDLATGLRVARFVAGAAPVDQVAWAPSGAILAAAVGVRVTSWDVRPDARPAAAVALLAADAPVALEDGQLVARPRPERAPETRVAVGPPIDATAEMKREFERGQDAYSRRDYAAAAESFRRAYAIKPAASLLFNAAVCDEKLGRHAEAAETFRTYLDVNPTARDRAAVEARIEALSR